MAYLAFDESGIARLPDGLARDGVRLRAAAALRDDTDPLTALEWSVVAIAHFDPLSSLRRPGRLATALGAMFRQSVNPRFANERLEALRRIAVLGWHHGDAVPAAEREAFVTAGFTPRQYDAMMARIAVERTRSGGRRR